MYQNELNKTLISTLFGLQYVQSTVRTVSNGVLCDKAFAVDSIYQYGAYQQGFTSVVKTFFEKKSKDFSSHTGTRFISENHQLASEIDSPITRK